jgi:hypothetical protein
MWLLASQRTTYGGEPSADLTSVISPHWSERSTVVPLITKKSPTLALIAHSFVSCL